ncbi:HNH endonuclease [Phycicoccus sp. MAQZ13P-2]|uniref:HNH endonuclease signature motif containing protein n=1 Tax=Phycicoccus mangrovi TaxID=2840470 RepID=UPI001C0082A9|nr:HNH endonuclease signature motif containing protein [Phycicoccus mangrovi]MBT9257637.1 HNH endonuclease [Phycicoccus mangrovi]MBT9276076.1 HNH endonuclease [Phycicoccus mangrovi]
MVDPTQVTAVVRAARELLDGVHSPAPVGGSLEHCASLVGELQSLANVVTALQDSAIVALAAVETDVAEDGTVVERRRAPGHVALDAPAIVSGVLCLSSVAAERRVRDAVRRAADGPDGTGTHTGLGGLHDAMGGGRLDAFRAQVVAHELEEVPADVAATVVATIDEHLDREAAPALRRRVRRALARISPDLLRQRAVRARSESSLQRWVDEPGVDTWHGTFPSEEACAAWAAIDRLAQQYVADGVCDRIDRARAKALTDLVIGQATIDLRVSLATPVGSAVVAERNSMAPLAAGSDSDLVEVTGLRPGDPVLVPRGWLATVLERNSGAEAADSTPFLRCDPSSGAPVDPDGALATAAYRPGVRLAAFVRDRDQHCRFPGCHVAARFCDLDHVVPFPAGPTRASNLACLCRRHHRTKQRPGWRAVLHPDATMTWTDPTGRVRTTQPPDRLGLTVLPDTGTDAEPPPRRRPRLALPDGPHSALEHHLEHELPAPACRVHVIRPLVPMTCALRPHPRSRRADTSRVIAPPPF